MSLCLIFSSGVMPYRNWSKPLPGVIRPVSGSFNDVPSRPIELTGNVLLDVKLVYKTLILHHLLNFLLAIPRHSQHGHILVDGPEKRTPLPWAQPPPQSLPGVAEVPQGDHVVKCP